MPLNQSAATLPAVCRARLERHEAFWRGEGPSLIFIPTGRMDQYEVGGYRERFEFPRLMWEAEMRRANLVLNWPTDGIPTVRPNLGVVFIPAIAGAGYHLHDGQMPWPGAPLDREAIRAIPGLDIAASAIWRRAAEFYAIHQTERGPAAAYAPDTQGVFDLAHMLNGADVFFDVVDDPAWVHDVMGIALRLFIEVTRRTKEAMAEAATTMIHGHGTPQGLHFPRGGARSSEDTAILLSPKMLQEYVLPYVDQGLQPFGGGFVHFCGRHEALFEGLCLSPWVQAIDLGNSESFDLRWLLDRCAETETVLYSRIACVPGEEWQAYVRRIGTLVKETGARVVLRPLASPENRVDCAAMLDLWHELTC